MWSIFGVEKVRDCNTMIPLIILGSAKEAGSLSFLLAYDSYFALRSIIGCRLDGCGETVEIRRELRVAWQMEIIGGCGRNDKRMQ